MSVVNTSSRVIRFRRSGGIWLAAFLSWVFVMPFAVSVFVELSETTRLLLAPVAVVALIVPLLVVVWSLRSGVDAGPDGVTVKALFNGRRVRWSEITGFDRREGRVFAVLESGNRLELPSVRPADLPRLLAVSGREVSDEDAQ
ncbi:PH (Pleckstrin Homology) domain-containing protein [Stackebrandtia albiflava]|uniref:PH (Pleckstrin Homology) domain-containing protein n=1 Tax=Stackebrandtia albiflava TaxID=406432 RepID=A0A562UQU3_9ACTN|nr:PH domain-containing protein [Stackebrandtia albiflava]TWJ07993.1 PH (Pleckstrin Homology) domain-containing protein [Stackebrandtia albiflava]